MFYKVLIIEDEAHQQQRLSELLGDFNDLVIIGTAISVKEGEELLATHSPDLVFMDVMLASGTSFDLLAKLRSIPFEIIFVTSYMEYAIKAFRLSAIDYLLKPVSAEHLSEAIAKFRQKKTPSENTMQIKALLDNLLPERLEQAKIALPTFTGFILVPVKSIVRCESDNTYTTFFVSDKRKIIVSRTLKECEKMLADHHFCRVHNSHLINMDYVCEYTRGEGGVVTMTDGSQIDVSRRRKDEFLSQFKRS